ncbi:MAG TPA: thioredoxin family protein [Bacteroidia bacterium]|nr:thioredoxin family protein [Bacteroidia bacterium]HNP97456.1 thioredoxin family protein [Bacteroidia bacterium]
MLTPIQEHPLVLLDFHATWCEPCKWADPVIDLVLNHFDNKIFLLKIDIDEHPDYAKEFHILSVPTFILMKNGAEIWRMRGFDIAPKMIRIIEEKIQDPL